MVNLASVDLNLLVALDALLAEAHVGRAARRIGRSQPAVSHSLGRLRELFGDALLVRIGARMELTPRALSLRESLPEALDRVRSLLAVESFDPATSTRRFQVVIHDHLADLVVPAIVRRMSTAAPRARLEVLPWESPFAMTPERLRSLDLFTSCATRELAGFDRRPLFTDRDVVVVRRDHPLVARLGTRRTFVEARHIAVTRDPLDAWLLERGIERRIGLTVPSYLQALHAAAASDLVAFVPRRLAEALSAALSLAIVKPPIDPGPYQEFAFTPQRSDGDGAARWLRDVVMTIGRDVDALRVGGHGLPRRQHLRRRAARAPR
ncbi:Transcriptional regulator, LysR family protein [Minicystis rosea]|nr:Transcriptional regulator, LysR family protein [Minicystis rosea]